MTRASRPTASRLPTNSADRHCSYETEPARRHIGPRSRPFAIRPLVTDRTGPPRRPVNLRFATLLRLESPPDVSVTPRCPWRLQLTGAPTGTSRCEKLGFG